MKKLTYVFLALLFAGATFTMSCKKSSSTVVGPSLHLLTGSGYISSNVSVQEATSLLFGISATAGDGKLTRCFVQRTSQGKAKTAKDTTISVTSFNYDLHAFALASVGTETWTFTIYDSNGGSAATSLTITTTLPNPSGPINTYSTKIMGAQISSSGNFFASSNGTVYLLADAKTNSALIDWAYFYDAINQGTLAAPTDTAAIAAYNNGANGIPNWSVRNATLFKLVTVPYFWTDIVNDSIIVIENKSGVTLSKINNLSVGNLIAFKTAAGKEGMIRVDALTPDVTGTITIDVKVQQ
jgi:hypothetical protein